MSSSETVKKVQDAVISRLKKFKASSKHVMARPWTFDPRAVKLNQDLYENNPDLDPAMLARVRKEIDEISDMLKYEKSYRAAWQSHAERLSASIIELRKVIQPGQRVLELGWPTLTLHLLRSHFPDAHIESGAFEVRQNWPLADASIDGVISMEVFEHLSDIPDGINETVTFSGFQGCLNESFRALRPGGWVFGTTPNGTSVVNLLSVLWGATPWFYQPHFREYGRADITKLALNAGFEIETLRAAHVLTVSNKTDYTPVFDALIRYGYTLQDRGDNWFITLRKPAR